MYNAGYGVASSILADRVGTYTESSMSHSGVASAMFGLCEHRGHLAQSSKVTLEADHPGPRRVESSSGLAYGPATFGCTGPGSRTGFGLFPGEYGLRAWCSDAFLK